MNKNISVSRSLVMKTEKDKEGVEQATIYIDLDILKIELKEYVFEMIETYGKMMQKKVAKASKLFIPKGLK